MDVPQAILIVKMSAIGDVVMATPLAETIKKAYPDAHLAWLVEERCKDVVLGNPYLDEVFVWKRRKGAFRIPPSLPPVQRMRRRRFDVSIDAQGLLRSAVLGYLSGAAVRIGLKDGRELSPLLYNLTAQSSPSVVESHQRLLSPLNIPAEAISSSMLFPLTDTDRSETRDLLASQGIRDEQSIAVIAPATTWPNKHWLESEWAALAEHLSSMGLTPLFLGARANIEMIERIRSQARATTLSLAGVTSLKQAGAVISMARLMISVDTGLMHVSVALGTPTVALFGPTTEWVNHADKPNFRVVRRPDLPCAPCRRKPTCKDFDCMRAIKADEVVESVAGLVKLPCHPV